MKVPAFALLVALIGTTACATLTPTITQIAPTPTLMPFSTPQIPATPTFVPFECQTAFSAHEANGSTSGSGTRITLSAEAWTSYLNQMGIESLCVPLELGAPFVNADWDQARMPATGRMISIGFENFYRGSGWSDIYLVYSTYDFTTGTEFDRFASLEDRDALRDHAAAGEVEVGGIRGILRFMPSQWGYENQPQIVYKTWVFPFENHYLAVVYNLGAFDGDVNEWILRLQRDEYPIDQTPYIKMLDFLARSLRFQASQ